MPANPALASGGPTASTSWLPDGPTTATAMDAMIDWVLVVAIDGVSCVSSWARVTWVWCASLSLATASWAKSSCSRPSCATGPVNGASIAIEAMHWCCRLAAAVVAWCSLAAAEHRHADCGEPPLRRR